MQGGLGEIGEAPALPYDQKGGYHGARSRQKGGCGIFRKGEKSSSPPRLRTRRFFCDLRRRDILKVSGREASRDFQPVASGAGRTGSICLNP